MTYRRAASAGILGSVVAALALFRMGGNAPPRFGDPLPGLTRDQLARFQAGKAVFDHDFDVPGGLGLVDAVPDESHIFRCISFVDHALFL